MQGWPRNPGRCVQSQGPGPVLAKGRNKVGLGSETWSVIELRREWGLVEKGSIALSVSGAASLHHIWTPPPQGVAWVTQELGIPGPVRGGGVYGILTDSC